MDLKEDFIEANNFLKNEEGNIEMPSFECEYAFWECLFNKDSENEQDGDKDDQLLEKLKSLDGKKT